MNVASDLGILSSGEWTPCSAVDVNQVDPLLLWEVRADSEGNAGTHRSFGPDLASGQ